MLLFRSQTRTVRMFTTLLALFVAFSVVGLQVTGSVPELCLDNCGDDCEDDCQDFCGCLHCLASPAAVTVSIFDRHHDDGFTGSAGPGLRPCFDQAWVGAIDHPPQLSL